MLRTDLKMALRHVRRHRGYTFLNAFGLAVGLACCMLILLFVRHERSYDRFHERADRIYRVVDDEYKEGGIHVHSAATPARLATELAEDPAVERTVRFLRYGVFTTPLVGRDAREKHLEPGFFFADSTVFDVFSFPLLSGDPRTALAAPFTVVLTESASRKYFGDEDPVGRTLTFENRFDFTVTGVMADLPSNTHVQFDLLGSFGSLGRIEGDWIYRYWNWPPMYTYVLLREGADAEALAARLPAFERANLGQDLAARRDFSLQPISSIHLHSRREQEWQPNGNAAYVALFSVVAVLIVLIACINFMNLATARSVQRAREVGVRKVLGARRGQLVRQFLGETLLAAGLALAAAFGLAVLALPVFNAVAAKTLVVADLVGGVVPWTMAGVALAAGLLAGSLPAFYLSGFRPAAALRGRVAPAGGGGAAVRKGLVVFQFALTCTLLVGTAAVYLQLDFLRSKALGFEREHVLVVPLPGEEAELNYTSLKDQWRRHPRVVDVAATSGIPPDTEGLYDFPVVLRGAKTDSLEMLTLAVDHDFVETFGLDVVAGRDFSEDYPTDETGAFLLNERAVQKLGLEAPLGQELTLYHYADGPTPKTGRVVGVVRDFHYESLHHPIEPIVFYILPVTAQISYYSFLSVRLDPEDLPGTLAYLEQSWQAFQPDRPFDFTFLDARFDALYRAEERLGTLFGYLAGLAVLVACLGLFGLAAYSAEQRTKEIGVRKVLGASVSQIVLLLSKDFVRLVALAFVLAMPPAYVATHRWLDAFAYRMELSWWIFAAVGLVALVVAQATVGYQALRAALTDPVRALRQE